MLISHMANMTNVFEAQQAIFTNYTIENTMINGKSHYTSDDGTRVLWYNECPVGQWIVGLPDDR